MAVFYRKDGFVKTTLGPAVAGAQVYVCGQPANINTLPILPSPLVSLFSDPNGLVPLAQPVITDGFGHYVYYVAPGLYTEAIAYGGKIQQVYSDQSIGNVSTSGSGSSIIFETNGTPNFNQLTQNLIQGSGVTLVTDNLGNTTVSSTGGGGFTAVASGTGTAKKVSNPNNVSLITSAMANGYYYLLLNNIMTVPGIGVGNVSAELHGKDRFGNSLDLGPSELSTDTSAGVTNSFISLIDVGLGQSLSFDITFDDAPAESFYEYTLIKLI